MSANALCFTIGIPIVNSTELAGEPSKTALSIGTATYSGPATSDGCITQTQSSSFTVTPVSTISGPICGSSGYDVHQQTTSTISTSISDGSVQQTRPSSSTVLLDSCPACNCISSGAVVGAVVAVIVIVIISVVVHGILVFLVTR